MTATDPLPVLAKEPPSPPSTPPESVQSYIYYWTGPGAALAVVPRWSWQSIPPLPAGRIDPHLASMEANTMLFLHLFSSTDDEKVVQDPRNPAPAKALRRSASCHLRSDHPSRPPPPQGSCSCTELPLLLVFTELDRSFQPPSHFFKLVYQASVVSISYPCPLSSSS